MVDGHTALGNAAPDAGSGELRSASWKSRRSFAGTAPKRSTSRSTAAWPGTIAVADPIKPTTADASDQLRDQGIRIVMLTGDNRGPPPMRSPANSASPRSRPRCCRRTSTLSFSRLRAAGTCGRDGWRRRQRCPCPRGRRCRHRHGHRHRGRHEQRRHHSGERRPHRHRARHHAQPRHHAQHPPKPVLAFVYNVSACRSASGVLYPAFGVLLSPMVAALAMSLSSVSVIGNALRLRGLQTLTLETLLQLALRYQSDSRTQGDAAGCSSIRRKALEPPPRVPSRNGNARCWHNGLPAPIARERWASSPHMSVSEAVTTRDCET